MKRPAQDLPSPVLSQFGQRLGAESGIVSLMEDLGEALNVNRDMLFLGGGNPASVPAFEQRVGRHLAALVDDPLGLRKLLGVYQSPRGSEEFLELLAEFLREQMGWPVGVENLALSNGSQSAFFLIMNMLAGTRGDGSTGQICLPLMPEYLGYRDQGISANMFRGVRPEIELLGVDSFKYKVDFQRLEITPDTAALCVSRPTNPTGNVITDDEMAHLNALSLEHGIPLIVDCAYGAPFPNIVYEPVEHRWRSNNIFVLSLSKLGLPGVRTGIVVAEPAFIERFIRANTILCLANGNLGPALGASLLRHEDLRALCATELLPFYEAQRLTMFQLLRTRLHGLNYRVHKSEGAFFVWLWLPDLSISSTALYQRLKARSVLVMAGEHFFFGLDEHWAHTEQCIRLNFCQPEAVIDQALTILADELRALSSR